MKITLHLLLLLSVLTVFGACNGQYQKTPESKAQQVLTINISDTVLNIGKNIGCILQDNNDNYWFASNGEGVYRYDGKTLLHITDKDGLCSNFVWTIQQDANSNLWFSTRDGICQLNGNTFTDYTNTIENAPFGKLQYTSGGLFFGHLNGICLYDGKSFTNFAIHPDNYSPSPSSMNRPYSIYSTLIDKAGNVWFGTQEKGICRYDGNSFTFFTEQGLSKAAVRTLFQDKTGTIWAGNNGAGLFKFNGTAFTNYTDEKGLANPNFLKNLEGKEGTLARPWAINEDDKGNLWIATIDAGVWKYKGDSLTNYTTKDGLTSNSIWTIYKDNKSELWFVAGGETICKFDGNAFFKYEFR